MKEVRTPGRIKGVPNQPKSKHRMVRFSDEDWADLGELAESVGSDRSAILRQLAHWWMGRPGVELPERPESRKAADE